MRNTMTDIPAVATHIAEDRGIWVLRVSCPYCDRMHRHGGGLVKAGPPSLGHRQSHCLAGEGGGYVLTPGPAGMPEPVDRRRRKGVHDVTGGRD